MRFPRAGGILLHPTSLPGPGGIGSLGREAFDFLDTLANAGMQLWQVLPLGPTGYGDSPYQSFSAFAGNPLLISLQALREDGLLTENDLSVLPSVSTIGVDFGHVVTHKMAVLRRAHERGRDRAAVQERVHAFASQNTSWLDDFALFMALKDAYGGKPWNEWEEPLRRRDRSALDVVRRRLEDDIAFHKFVQSQFFEQWAELKAHAAKRSIRVVGDIPIFVAYDSSDVWANQELFQLRPDGQPEVVAGVPPDYFSATGQLWGNPHYRWDRMQENGFHWWIERFQSLLRLVDVVRLDHFRGFAASWAVPFGEPTAEHGEWVPSPGRALFETLERALGRLPIIAEDLGVITPDVEALRDDFDFPGMKILQFAFAGGPGDASLPHTYGHNCVVYTGTHDNQTTVGWYDSRDEKERAWVCDYVGTQGTDVSWDLIRLAFASVADMAIAPLQDVLRLGDAARMNFPGRPQGNWSWRFSEGDITVSHIRGLRRLAETYDRLRASDADVSPEPASLSGALHTP